MSWPQVLSSRTVRARVPHRCSTCQVVCIQPGDQYQRDGILNDGRVYTWVMCSECAAIFVTVWEWAGETDDGVGPDTYLEWAQELTAMDPRAAAYLTRVGAG